MLEIALLGFITPIAIYILQFFSRKNNCKIMSSLIWMGLLFLIRLCLVYLDMPSRNILSYLGANVVYGLIYYLITMCLQADFNNSYGIMDYIKTAFTASGKFVPTCLGILLIVYLVGGVNTWCNINQLTIQLVR